MHTSQISESLCLMGHSLTCPLSVCLLFPFDVATFPFDVVARCPLTLVRRCSCLEKVEGGAMPLSFDTAVVVLEDSPLMAVRPRECLEDGLIDSSSLVCTAWASPKSTSWNLERRKQWMSSAWLSESM